MPRGDRADLKARAERILEDDLVKGALNSLRARAVKALEELPTEEEDTILARVADLRAAARFEKAFVKFVNAGKLEPDED